MKRAAVPLTGEDYLTFINRRMQEMGFDQPQADYGGKVAEWVNELATVLKGQGHSGGSMGLTVDVLLKVTDEFLQRES